MPRQVLFFHFVEFEPGLPAFPLDFGFLGLVLLEDVVVNSLGGGVQDGRVSDLVLQ